jgi:hypothetical protein
VSWIFVGLEDLEELDVSIHDGTELRNRFFKHKDPSSLASQKDDLSVFLPEHSERQKVSRIITEREPFGDEGD